MLTLQACHSEINVLSRAIGWERERVRNIPLTAEQNPHLLEWALVAGFLDAQRDIGSTARDTIDDLPRPEGVHRGDMTTALAILGVDPIIALLGHYGAEHDIDAREVRDLIKRIRVAAQT